MIAVDTSVWVAALRWGESREAVELRNLLDRDEVVLVVPVRIELLGGASNRDRPRLRRLLSALPLLYPTASTWRRIDGWIDRTGRSGERFGFADLLIAGITAEAGASIWSLDRDFSCMAKLGFLALHRP